MNQAELIDAIHEATGPKRQSKNNILCVLNGLAHVAGAELVEGGEVTLPGLGKLKTDQRAARTGRNPATGEALEIPAKTVVKFSPAKVLKDALA